ncbi:putative acetyltransferase [Legionella massiliensis]|uniref:Putative acetyltransferase n=1 Tax=Legionella massiliensis TaxID=1034943 RepID=A0A078KX86_9GAMM|nr:GNAT family N-acetyltransferase [Legionella massiliensis]CDZ79010.1 putative acetyltransferase [Legionella massiliensis]CEE14748.1 putative acetyltransferase [Legionella massiliensis]
MNTNSQLKPKLVAASISDYPAIQSMWLFYIYDLGRQYNFDRNWKYLSNLSFVSDNLMPYFSDKNRKAFLIKIDEEMAGFVFLNKASIFTDNTWNIAEFFVLAKFQGKGIGAEIAKQVWEQFPGPWEVSVIPNNKTALAFWRKIIARFNDGNYTETIKEIDYDKEHSLRNIFCFNTEIQQGQRQSRDENYKIAFIDELSEEIEKKMRRDLVAYESNHGVDVNYKPFSLVLSNEKDGVFAVLNAYTAFAEVYIDDLWVDKAHRGKGYGKKLIQALEQHFEGKGFNNINLVTSAFQAPDFYKKCGFTAEFIRENKKNPQLNKTFFVKYFANEVQNQGLS